MHWFTLRSLEHGYFYLFIYFQFLRRCFKDANFSAIIQNPMEKPVGFLSREPRATLTSGLANIRHPSTTLYCNNTCWSWMIMNEFILYSALVFIYLFSSEMHCVCVCACARVYNTLFYVGMRRNPVFTKTYPVNVCFCRLGWLSDVFQTRWYH